MNKRRRVFTTLLAVVFTAAVLAITAAVCTLTVSSRRAYAAGSDQTSTSFAKLEFDGTTEYFDDTGDGTVTLLTVFEAANGKATTEANPAVITMLTDREAKFTVTLPVNENKHIVLDLNGRRLHFTGNATSPNTKNSPITVNRNGHLTIKDSDTTSTHKYRIDPDSKLYVFQKTGESGTFDMTLQGGVLTGGYTDKDSSNNNKGGGCVEVLSHGVLTMEGGTIAGNHATNHGGGVYVNGGTFNLSGGMIAGNVSGRNGGVYIGGDGVINMSGTPVIKDNFGTAEKVAHNVYVNVDSVGIVGKLQEPASIGLTMSKNSVKFNDTTDPKHTGAELAKFFQFDNGNCISIDSNGNITQGSTHTVTDTTWLYDAAGHWQVCSVCNSKANYGVHTFSDSGICTVCGYSYAQWVATVTLPDGTTTGYESLEEAFNAANAADSSKAAVTVKLYDDTECSDGLAVNSGNDISLDLNGHTLTGPANKTVITVHGTFTLNDGDNKTNTGTIYPQDYCNNAVTVENDATFNMRGGTLNGENAYGSYGVFSGKGSAFTMTGGVITSNTVYTDSDDISSGGGVCAWESSFVMTDGEISGNTAAEGGGVCLQGGLFIMSGDAIISGNSAKKGGGVYVADGGSFDMSGGEISGNTGTSGGGVYVQSNCTFEMSGTAKISGNQGVDGDGVIVDGGSFTMNGGEISDNLITEVALINDGSFKMTGGTLKSNGYLVETSSGVYLELSGNPNLLSDTDGGINLSTGVQITIIGALDEGVIIPVQAASDGVIAVPAEGVTLNPKNFVSLDPLYPCVYLNQDGQVEVGQHDTINYSLSIKQQPDKLSGYNAFDKFDTTGMQVYKHCTKCDSDLEEVPANTAASGEATNGYVIIYPTTNHDHFHAGDEKVTVGFETNRVDVELEAPVGRYEVTNYKWQYAADTGTADWVDFTDNSFELMYSPSAGGLKGHFRIIFTDPAGFEHTFRAQDTEVLTTLNGAPQDTILNAGEYTLSLKYEDFDSLKDFTFPAGYEGKLTITPDKIRLNNPDNFHWVLDSANSRLRDGYIYINTADASDPNNYKYYSQIPENAENTEYYNRVIGSIVRNRGAEVGIHLFGYRATAEGGNIYTISAGSGCTASGLGAYTAHATLTCSDTNYIFTDEAVAGYPAIDADRHMTVTISADGRSATVEKIWYIAQIDNGLLSQYDDENGHTYGGDWNMADWTYGSYKTQYAPRLEHGDPGDPDGTKTFAQTDSDYDLVSFKLYRIYQPQGGSVTREQLGDTFYRYNFADYINGSVPAGTYSLEVSVKGYTTNAHVHWYDGTPHAGADAGVYYDAFTRSFNFTVGKAALAASDTNISELNGKAFTYEYDGNLHLFGSTFALNTEVNANRSGIWAGSNFDSFYTVAMQYHLLRYGGATWLSEGGLNGVADKSNVPVNANRDGDVYTVYFRVVAENYNELGNDQTYSFTVKITRKQVTKPEGKEATYGESVTVADHSDGLYRVVGSNTFTNANEAGYDVQLRLSDSVNYEWAGGNGDTTTIKVVIHKAAVTVPQGMQVSYNGAPQTYTVVSGALFAVSGTAAYTNAGTHEITLALKDSANYAWKNADGSLAAESAVKVNLVILKAKVTVPKDFEATFNGGTVTPEAKPTAHYTIQGNPAFDKAGVYDITLVLKDADNYEWVDSNGQTLSGNTATIKFNLKAPEVTAAGGSSNNTLWLVLVIITSVVIAGEIGYLIFRAVRGNKSEKGANII